MIEGGVTFPKGTFGKLTVFARQRLRLTIRRYIPRDAMVLMWRVLSHRCSELAYDSIYFVQRELTKLLLPASRIRVCFVKVADNSYVFVI